MPILGFDSICIERAKIIVSKDRRGSRKHKAKNVGQAIVNHYRIDGVVLKEGLKCDFLLLQEDTKKVYFIELKGEDLTQAARQIEATCENLKNQLENYDKEYRIVASKCRTQNIEDASFKKYRQKWKSHLQYKTEILEEDI